MSTGDARGEIAAALVDARARTLLLTADLQGEAWLGPRLPIVNPPLWEVGHVGYFQELWVLRRGRGHAPSIPRADDLYDSARVAHGLRWDLPLIPVAEMRAYIAEVLERSLRALEETTDDYLHRLALFHEDMHGEAFYYTRQTLARPAPAVEIPPAPSGALLAGPFPGDVEVPGGPYLLGARPDIEGARGALRDAGAGFVFDNEKWAHTVEVAPFSIARAPVTNAEFAAFVDAGGYADPGLWSDEGWQWRTAEGATMPVYWERSPGGDWQVRRFQAAIPLPPHQPVIHVNCHEAEAYCRWAGRRLPTEAEWELAASGREKRRFPWGDAPPGPGHANVDLRWGGPADVAAFPDGDSPFGCRQMIGNVWEWTASRFAPYPGFVVDPYKEYSEPWFHSPHRVLRGGCFVTRGRLLRSTWRNFYPPHRRDVLAGFRTCAARSP